MSSKSNMVVFERQLQNAKLLVTLTNEAKNKLILNEKYVDHLRTLLEEAVKTSVELKICHEDRASAAVDALQKLTKTVGKVDRNTQAVEQLRERVAALGQKIGFPIASVLDIESPAQATRSTQCLPSLADAIPEDGEEVKRVQSGTSGKAGAAGGAVKRSTEDSPKTLSRNSIVKPCELPKNVEEFFNAFRKDQPPERRYQRVATISEDDDEDENPRGYYAPLM